MGLTGSGMNGMPGPDPTILVWHTGSHIPESVVPWQPSFGVLDSSGNSVTVTGQNVGVTADFRGAPMGNKNDPGAPRRVIEDTSKQQGDEHSLRLATKDYRVLKGEVASLETIRVKSAEGVEIAKSKTSEGVYKYRDDGYIKDNVSSGTKTRGANVNGRVTKEQTYRVWFRPPGGVGMRYDIDLSKLTQTHTFTNGHVTNRLDIEQLP